MTIEVLGYQNGANNSVWGSQYTGALAKPRERTSPPTTFIRGAVLLSKQLLAMTIFTYTKSYIASIQTRLKLNFQATKYKK